MEIKLVICFSFVIPTINFQWLKILLVTLVFFIVEYKFLKQFVKLLMIKYTYLLILRCIVMYFDVYLNIRDYTENWSREIFVIDSMLKTNPWMYKCIYLDVYFKFEKDNNQSVRATERKNTQSVRSLYFWTAVYCCLLGNCIDDLNLILKWSCLI